MALEPVKENESADFDLRIVRSLALYLHDKKGKEALTRIAAAGNFTPEDVLRGSKWVPARRLHAFLEAAFKELGEDEDLFRRAAYYRLKDAYGPIRYVMLAATPSTVLVLAGNTFGLVSRIGRYEVMNVRKDSLLARYHGTEHQREHRLLCLLRQANGIGLPTMWGLPPGAIKEKGCVANGDPFCEYEVRWAETLSWWSTIGFGGGLGLIATVLLYMAGVLGSFSWLILLPAVGILLGYVYNLRYRLHGNLVFTEEQRIALQEIAVEDARIRQELQLLHQRQSEWTQVLEQQVQERTEALQEMVEKLRLLQEQQLTTVRGYSHDMNSPLTIVGSLTYWLKRAEGVSPAEQQEILAEHDHAVETIKKITRELWQVADRQQELVLKPERLVVQGLSETLRRRLQALVFGRDIRVSVFDTREAPAEIEIDLLAFDRIVDNLLGNAAKYTARGSILVELTGVPDFLVLKISDTGRGIADDKIEAIFRPGGSEAGARAPGSHGYGLSVTVRLLAQLGGRLEVMSKPAVGTTFWVYLPHKMRTQRTSLTAEPAPAGGAGGDAGKVVRIRRLKAEVK